MYKTNLLLYLVVPMGSILNIFVYLFYCYNVLTVYQRYEVTQLEKSVLSSWHVDNVIFVIFALRHFHFLVIISWKTFIALTLRAGD